MLTDLNTDIRVFGVNVWTFTFNVTYTIDNGIFNPLRTIHSVINQT